MEPQQLKLYDQRSRARNDHVDITENKHGGEEHSTLANKAAVQNKSVQRGKIIRLMAERGTLIADEAGLELGICMAGCSARFTELKADGVIVKVLDDKGKQLKRLTRNGRWGGVWKLNPALAQPC